MMRTKTFRGGAILLFFIFFISVPFVFAENHTVIENNIQNDIVFPNEFVFIFLYIGLYLTGYFTKSYALIIASGVISLIAIFNTQIVPDPNLNAIFLISLSIVSIYHGIYLIMTNPNRKQYVKKKDD
jgi:hypothetical protein